MLQVQFVKKHEDAKLPERNNKCRFTGDTGYDVFSVEDVVIPARGSAVVNVGLKLGHLTRGWWFRVEPRSGLGFKKNIQPHLGVIDNAYRGACGVKLYNFGDEDVKLEKGIAVAQFVFYKLNVANEVSWIDEDQVIETERGEKGFGSSSNM